MLLKYCAEAGCSAIIQKSESYCAIHKARHIKQEQERKRNWQGASRAGNYHNAQWYAMRARAKKEHPYCAYCGASTRLEVHHIKSVRLHPELMYDFSNLLVLCHSCHAIETRREIEQRRRQGGGGKKLK